LQTYLPAPILLTDYVTTGNGREKWRPPPLFDRELNFNLTVIVAAVKFFRPSRQYFAENKRVNKRVNSVPSFKVSSIFTPMKTEDIFPMENPNQYAVYKI